MQKRETTPTPITDFAENVLVNGGQLELGNVDAD
jgi:hypothetical protein